MRFLLSLVAAALTFGAAAAVDIVLFPSNSSCLPGYSWTCSNVAALTCCRTPPIGYFSPYFSSARCEGLGASDTCAIALVGAGSGECGATCASSAAACVSADPCWRHHASGFGAYWVAPAGPRAAEREARADGECKGTVEPDRVAFANGQAFRVDHGVPAEITALLAELAKTDPLLARGAPASAAPYEIKAENEG